MRLYVQFVKFQGSKPRNLNLLNTVKFLAALKVLLGYTYFKLLHAIKNQRKLLNHVLVKPNPIVEYDESNSYSLKRTNVLMNRYYTSIPIGKDLYEKILE